ncbi:MAG: hypothetical protein QME70_06350 [Bacillota bacterium]|nr:hypothetical protein [Bacillota bacterium]
MMRPDLLSRIPEQVISVARRLREAGHAVYVVGGALRDLLLGREPGDWDLATSARPEEMRPLFAGWRVIDVGARHGTLGIIPPGSAGPPGTPAPVPPGPPGTPPSGVSDDAGMPGPQPGTGGVIEVTTFRAEGPYSDFRHPDYVRFVADLNEDLSRRDFTVNALALDPFTGDLHDPCGGQEDMRRGLVRAVGHAESRFREDAIRPLRTFRLVSEYGWEIEETTSQAVVRCAALVERVAPERVRAELERILRGPRAGKALRLMAAHDLLGRIFPGITPSSVPWDAIDRLPPRVELRLALLLEGTGLPRGGAARAAVAATLARWRFPTQVAEEVGALVAHRADESLLEADPARLRRWIAGTGRARALDLVEIAGARWSGEADELARARGREAAHELGRRVRSQLDRGFPTAVEELPVGGHDVMELLHLSPGPRVGEVLHHLLELVWDDPSLNDRRALLELLKRLRSL